MSDKQQEGAAMTEVLQKSPEALDAEYWHRLDALVAQHDLSTKDLLGNYLAFIQRRSVCRLLAHYEMFKLIRDLPGSIVEIGVFMGSGLFTWSYFLETFCASDRVRKVFGFDDFEGYSKYSQHDHQASAFVDRKMHHLQTDRSLIEALNALHNDDNILKGVERSRIIPGNILETVPRFCEAMRGLRLSLLYLDANLYEPTKVALEHFYPLVVPGGVVAFNGYGQHPWEGESSALDELFRSLPYRPTLQRFPFSNIPGGFFVKEAC
jgi:hypothetical protein